MNTSLQLSLLVVMAMLCVLVTGNYMVNHYQVQDSALRKHTKETPPVDNAGTRSSQEVHLQHH